MIADTNIKITQMSQRTSNLIIEKVSSNDAGNYTCNVRNTFGNDEHTIRLIIKGINDVFLRFWLIEFELYLKLLLDGFQFHLI